MSLIVNVCTGICVSPSFKLDLIEICFNFFIFFLIGRSQSHSINFITEDYLSGFRDDGRMSVVRRFFCLFVTFDFIFTALLWLICVMVSYFFLI